MQIISSQKLFKKNRVTILLELIKDHELKLYCIRCNGQGHYFKTAEEAESYVYDRFKKLVTIRGWPEKEPP